MIRSELQYDKGMEEGPWRREHIWVSPFNFEDAVAAKRTPPKEIVIHDSTLRDGEQAPGVSFDTEAKLRIARALDEVGVQYIEAGFPPVSEQDRASITAICKAGLNARITCLVRAMKGDIDMAAACGVWGVVMEVPVGYPRLQYQFEWTERRLYDQVMEMTAYARSKGLHVILFLIDTARARLGFLDQLLSDVAASGNVDRVALVDTVGAIAPDAMNWLVGHFKALLPLPLEVHCHNDLGLAQANTLAGLMAGAEVASCTVCGLGQRAGNAATEDVIMGMKVAYGVPCALDTTKLVGLAELVQELTGYRHVPFREVVGKNVFRWAAGIPVAALLKEPRTVEAFGPELLGRRHEITLDKKAGKANVNWAVKRLGLPPLAEDATAALVDAVKKLASEKGSALTDPEFINLYTQMATAG